VELVRCYGVRTVSRAGFPDEDDPDMLQLRETVCTISNALYDADTPQIQGQMYCDPPYVWTMMHTR
jgi:hypothetical protein